MRSQAAPASPSPRRDAVNLRPGSSRAPGVGCRFFPLASRHHRKLRRAQLPSNGINFHQRRATLMYRILLVAENGFHGITVQVHGAVAKATFNRPKPTARRAGVFIGLTADWDATDRQHFVTKLCRFRVASAGSTSSLNVVRSVSQQRQRSLRGEPTRSRFTGRRQHGGMAHFQQR